jgi:Fe-S-cluster-containing hydrogenase component 2
VHANPQGLRLHSSNPLDPVEPSIESDDLVELVPLHKNGVVRIGEGEVEVHLGLARHETLPLQWIDLLVKQALDLALPMRPRRHAGGGGRSEHPVGGKPLSDSSRSAGSILSAEVGRSGVVQADEKLCLTCRECEVACSLSHERECNPHLSRVQVDFDDYRPGFPDVRLCKQCAWPACYYACAARNADPAMSIDPVTGARYVDESKCIGCGACAKACPLTPERPVLRAKKVGKRRVYFKCDLCKDRAQGPVCVQVCPAHSLTFTPADRRRG